MSTLAQKILGALDTALSGQSKIKSEHKEHQELRAQVVAKIGAEATKKLCRLNLMSRPAQIKSFKEVLAENAPAPVAQVEQPKITKPEPKPAMTTATPKPAAVAPAAPMKSTAEFIAQHQRLTTATNARLLERIESHVGKQAADNFNAVSDAVASITGTTKEAILRKLVNDMEGKAANNSPKLMAARANLSAHAALKGSPRTCAPCLAELEALHSMVFGAKESAAYHTYVAEDKRASAITEAFFKARIQVPGADYSGFKIARADENKVGFDAKRLPAAREAVTDFYATLRGEQPIEKADSLGARVARQYERSLSEPAWKR